MKKTVVVRTNRQDRPGLLSQSRPNTGSVVWHSQGGGQICRRWWPHEIDISSIWISIFNHGLHPYLSGCGRLTIFTWMDNVLLQYYNLETTTTTKEWARVLMIDTWFWNSRWEQLSYWSLNYWCLILKSCFNCFSNTTALKHFSRFQYKAIETSN